MCRIHGRLRNIIPALSGKTRYAGESSKSTGIGDPSEIVLRGTVIAEFHRHEFMRMTPRNPDELMEGTKLLFHHY